MTAEAKAELQARWAKADQAVTKAIARPTGSPRQMEAVSYGTTFEDDRLNEHRVEEYIFKLGCALIDDLWKEQVRKVRASR